MKTILLSSILAVASCALGLLVLSVLQVEPSGEDFRAGIAGGIFTTLVFWGIVALGAGGAMIARRVPRMGRRLVLAIVCASFLSELAVIGLCFA